ncbi:DUF2330 domain-containing protein [Nocardia asteroides]|uniref:DUF2330 domain-containing protein n=1 Tax=Nocardia asteroides TaxID=1824 RepID=UPI001E33A1E8|nr:DUF2330 domain-containing protein [Nocardia asteroides]UGT59725.1 DUF2330 domain-containing protein [Nocardia asteroides]
MPLAARPRPAGVLATLLLAVAALTGGAAVPAAACACGAVAGTGEIATVNNEVALVHWDGARQTILMQLALRSDGDRAALVVPTPAPATVSAGSAGTFDELERRTAPEIVTERDFFGSDDLDGLSSAAAPGAGPTVLNQVTLGPLEATTLSGGGLDGVRNWLRDNGYHMRSEVVDTLAPYLADGWSFVAIRLTGADGLDGALDPVRLTFDATAPVYPMRMSSAATLPQSVRLYVLGEHRVRRTDPDVPRQFTEVEFAGRLTETDDPLLRELTAGGADYLTELAVSITDPARITSDFTFADADSDAEHRERITRTEQVQVLGAPAGPVILGAALLAATLVVIAVLRVFRRAR